MLLPADIRSGGELEHHAGHAVAGCRLVCAVSRRAYDLYLDWNLSLLAIKTKILCRSLRKVDFVRTQCWTVVIGSYFGTHTVLQIGHLDPGSKRKLV
jgi:hypothetical protein